MKISKQYLKQIIKEEVQKASKLPYDLYTYPTEQPYFIKKLKSLGYDVDGAKEIGAGTQGSAYLLKNGKVLKVTTDKSEAQASAIIAGKQTEYLVRIEKVFRFGKTGDYAIIMEKLNKLTDPNEQKFWSDFGFAIDVSNIKKAMTWEEMQKVFEKKLKIFFHLKENPKNLNFLPKNLEIFFNNAERYGAPQIINELYKYGIYYTDYHEGNIMKRGSRSVLIDLGFSKVKGTPNIPILEKNK